MVVIRNVVRAELSDCSAGERIIVACSGGADSLALSYAVAKRRKIALQVIGVTIDHQLQTVTSPGRKSYYAIKFDGNRHSGNSDHRC